MADIEPLAVAITEGARIVGRGRSKFYQLINEGQIPSIKLGRKSLVPVVALRAFIETKMREAA